MKSPNYGIYTIKTHKLWKKDRQLNSQQCLRTNPGVFILPHVASPFCVTNHRKSHVISSVSGCANSSLIKPLLPIVIFPRTSEPPLKIPFADIIVERCVMLLTVSSKGEQGQFIEFQTIWCWQMKCLQEQKGKYILCYLKVSLWEGSTKPLQLRIIHLKNGVLGILTWKGFSEDKE